VQRRGLERRHAQLAVVRDKFDAAKDFFLSPRPATHVPVQVKSSAIHVRNAAARG